jgi:hypothetical protein
MAVAQLSLVARRYRNATTGRTSTPKRPEALTAEGATTLGNDR